jgi:outer membrane protein assembly factor BamB
VRLKTGTLGFVVGIVFLISIPWSGSAAGVPASVVSILFDFGDGSYVWAYEPIGDPTASNATWNAVQRAASSYQIALNSTWFSCCGVGILDVGGRHPPAGFVGLLEWNRTTHRWDFLSTGISRLVVRNGDAIALYDAAFAPTPPYSSRAPVPTPDHPWPWVSFRGDSSNSGDAGNAAPDRIRVLWDRDTGRREIGSTPAVAGGKVFVTTMGWTLALDATDGKVLWNTTTAKGFSSPAIYNDSVYVGTSDGAIVRLNASDGTLRWRTPLLASPSFSGITSSPKVIFDRLFVGTFNETGGPGEVVALWEGNGSVAWRHWTGSIHYSSPAYADGTIYVGVMGRYNITSQVSFNPPYGVLSLNATTGQERWFTPTNGSVAASPAVVGGNLVVTAKDGRVYSLNRTTGTVVWEAAVDAGISSPAVFGGTVFVGGGAFGAPGRVVALDAFSGTVKWSFSPNGPVQSSVTYAGGLVVFATNTDHGTVYGVRATNGMLVWSFEPLPSQYILGSPVVADGVVYAPSDNGHVYALASALTDQTQLIPSFDLRVIGGVIVGASAVIAVAWILIRRRSRPGA